MMHRQAGAAENSLRGQRATIVGAGAGVTGLMGAQPRARSLACASGVSLCWWFVCAARLPGVNKLMETITTRRSRNQAVIGCVIALCICFTLWYLLPSMGSAAQSAVVPAVAADR